MRRKETCLSWVFLDCSLRHETPHQKHVFCDATRPAQRWGLHTRRQSAPGGAMWALCAIKQGQDCPVPWLIREQPALAVRPSKASGKDCPHLVACSLVALGLCLGEALKGILQGVKGGMVGAYWWQKRSWVSTASGVPQFIGTCVWSSAYCFPHCLPRCIVCANSSWGDAAARGGWVGRVGRPVPPLSSVLRGLSGQLLSDPSTDPG